MKYGIIILILTLSWGFGQCDANGDGNLDVLDVVIEVDCILLDCWEGEPVCADCGDSECCDCDGNVYETIQIGEQLWMAENLKVTHYKDGSEIPTGYSNAEWTELETGAYAVYDDDPSNTNIYGNLYNWYAVDDERGLCMDGWHVPSSEEWRILMDFIAPEGTVYWGNTIAGGKMKDNINWNGSNSSGFSALPGGYRGIDGDYYGGSYYRSTDDYIMELRDYDDLAVFVEWDLDSEGFSVRCLKD